jgi:hypothetical protein
MRVYHRTHHADAIEREGFRDGYKLFVAPDLPAGILEVHGIFVSADWPLDENEGADGDIVLELDIPKALFVEYEHVEDGKPYREAMVPAADLNRYRATLRRLSDDEVDDLRMRRWDSFGPLLGQPPDAA